MTDTNRILDIVERLEKAGPHWTVQGEPHLAFQAATLLSQQAERIGELTVALEQIERGSDESITRRVARKALASREEKP